jgi:signal transduction histidine kinase
MPTGRIDPRWPKLLSLAAHEVSTPLSVIAGYVRMLLTERVGPLPDAQRRMLLAVEESCAQLSLLVKQFRELSQLEDGTAKFKRGTLDVAAVLADAVAALPALPSREVAVDVTTRPAQPISGDAARLRGALTSVLHALRRELVTSDRLEVVVEPGDAQASVRITIGEPQRMELLRAAAATDLRTFDEWRGGIGLTLANARRIIESHGGQIWSPAEDWKAAAVISLPVRGH